MNTNKKESVENINNNAISKKPIDTTKKIYKPIYSYKPNQKTDKHNQTLQPSPYHKIVDLTRAIHATINELLGDSKGMVAVAVPASKSSQSSIPVSDINALNKSAGSSSAPTHKLSTYSEFIRQQKDVIHPTAQTLHQTVESIDRALLNSALTDPERLVNVKIEENIDK